MDADELGSIFRQAAYIQLGAINDVPGVREWADGKIEIAVRHELEASKLATATHCWMAANKAFSEVVIAGFEPGLAGQSVAMILPSLEQAYVKINVWPFGDRPEYLIV